MQVSEDGHPAWTREFMVPIGWVSPEPEPESINGMRIGDELEIEEHAMGASS